MLKIFSRTLVFVVILGLTVMLTNSLGARVPQARAVFNLSPEMENRTTASASSGPLWARSYGLFFGGPAFSYIYESDWPTAVQSMGDGTIAVAGITISQGRAGAYLEAGAVMALGASGAVKWEVIYPEDLSGKISSVFRGLTRTREGGLVAVGTYFDDANEDVLVMSLDQNGGVRWTNRYVPEGDTFGEAGAVVRTRDGGCAIAAKSVNGLWFFKLDQSGAVVWSEVISIPDLDVVKALQETSSGGFVIAGICLSEGGSKEWAWVLRLSASGGLLWHTSLSSDSASGRNATGVNSIVATRDGGFALAGVTQPPGTSTLKAWACKLNGAGNVSWSRTYNGGEASSIIQTSDGGLLMTSGYPARAFKLNASGAVQWAKKYERSLKTNRMTGAFEKNDGGYVMIASSDSIKLAPNFDYQPWIVMSVDKNGDSAPGCPFVRSITGDARNVPAQVVSGSFSVASVAAQVITLAIVPHTWPPVRVGHDVCSK
jgi:hypothetical protein